MSTSLPRFRLPFRSRRRIETEIDAEFAFHLDQRTAQLVSLGMSREHARERAAREFGEDKDARNYCLAEDLAHQRATRRAQWLADATFDLRHALRQLRQRPAFAVGAALTLALEMGGTSAIFAIISGLPRDE